MTLNVIPKLFFYFSKTVVFYLLLSLLWFFWVYQRTMQLLTWLLVLKIFLLFFSYSGRWHFQTIPIHLPLDLEEHILGNPIPYFPINLYQPFWPGPTGHCTVKQPQNFCFLEGVESNAAHWSWIWKIACPPKIRIFIWNCFLNRLPTRSFLSCIISELS